MHTRRLALLASLCAVLIGFAVAKQPEGTRAKALLTPTPTPLRSELILSGPTEVYVGELFLIMIQYVNIGVPSTTITLSPNNLAHFDPPMMMPCKSNEHITGCRAITLRATAGGLLKISASATGEVPIAGGGWAWGSAQERNPLMINVVDSNVTATATATNTATPCPTTVAMRDSACIGTPTITPTSESPTVTPLVKELILSAPPLVNVGDAFSLTIQYVNIGVPSTGITLNPIGTVQFDPPLTMPCMYNQHPTGCRTIGLRAVAPGTIEIDAGATGEVPIAGGGWAWGSAHARNSINVQVRSVLAYKTFIPYAKVQ